MNKELIERVKRGIEAGRSPGELKSDLTGQGFIEDEVVEALQQSVGQEKSSEDKRNVKIFTFKEVFDRVGYGFASVQFVNILLYMLGAGFFFIGIINGLKAILSLSLSSIIQEYAKVRTVSVKLLSKAGILFGFSFLFIAMAVAIKSIPLFSIALLIGSLGVVTYGDLYERLIEVHLKKEKLGKFLLNISHIGVLITGLSMVLSGLLFDRFPVMGADRIVLFGKSLPLFGYLICFEITAVSLILSGYVLHFVKEAVVSPPVQKGFFADYFMKLKANWNVFFKSKHLMLLLAAGSVSGLVQVLGNSYYGVYIFQKFEEGVFLGIFEGIFLNLSFIFLFAIVVSFLGPAFAEYLNKRVGLAPAMVFGSLLIAIMPLVSAYNPRFMPLFFANGLSVIGAAIIGMGQGLLVRKLVREEHRHAYYSIMGLGVIIPFLILIPVGAWIAQAFGLVLLFKVLAGIILFVSAPIYFTLVLASNEAKL